MTAAEAAAIISRPWHGAAVVATRHFAAHRGSSLGGRVAARVIAASLDAEIAISEFVASRVERVSVVIPNGVPSAPAGPHGDRLVLVAQRLEAEKSTEVALRSWERSKLRSHGWRLLIAGRGTEEGRLRALAMELQVEDSVEFLGFVADVDALFERTGAFLATAPAEPFGLSVVEAMARATPVIATAGGAHSETVGAVSTEWLFEPGDVNRCAELLDRLRDDATGSARYGCALRERQREHFSLEMHARALLDLYRVVLGR
jgi:glycosyltransferase involved in cell wall biosynthesis